MVTINPAILSVQCIFFFSGVERLNAKFQEISINITTIVIIIIIPLSDNYIDVAPQHSYKKQMCFLCSKCVLQITGIPSQTAWSKRKKSTKTPKEHRWTSLIFMARTFQNRGCCNNSILFGKIAPYFWGRIKTPAKQPISFTFTMDTCYYGLNDIYECIKSIPRTWLNDYLIQQFLLIPMPVFTCVSDWFLSSSLSFLLVAVIHQWFHTCFWYSRFSSEKDREKNEIERQKKNLTAANTIGIHKVSPYGGFYTRRQHDKQSLM